MSANDKLLAALYFMCSFVGCIHTQSRFAKWMRILFLDFYHFTMYMLMGDVVFIENKKSRIEFSRVCFNVIFNKLDSPLLELAHKFSARIIDLCHELCLSKRINAI